MIEDLLDESEQRFRRGSVDITFTNGLDSGADVEIYLLCKVLPGSALAPAVSLEGSPSVHFSLKHKSPPMQSPSIHFKPDKLQEALTPSEVKWYASVESIYLIWEKPKAKEFAGVRIFRTPERQLGDLREVSQEQEIYDGPGLVKSVSIVLPKIEKLFFSRPPLRSEGTLRLHAPAPRPKPVGSDDRTGSDNKRPAPPKISVLGVVRLDSDYYIDIPAEQHKTFTYVIYGHDKNGNLSYPVIVNAALAEPNEGVTTEAIGGTGVGP